MIIRTSFTRRNWDHLSSVVYKPAAFCTFLEGGSSWVKSQTSKGGNEAWPHSVFGECPAWRQRADRRWQQVLLQFWVLIICMPWEKIVQKTWPKFLNGCRMTKNAYLKAHLLLSTKIIPCSIASINFIARFLFISYVENLHFFFEAHISSILNLMQDSSTFFVLNIHLRYAET